MFDQKYGIGHTIISNQISNDNCDGNNASPRVSHKRLNWTEHSEHEVSKSLLDRE